MTYRERLEIVELELDAETARALDRVARYSDGKIDRTGAARLALARGLSDVLREAELHAAQHLSACPRCGSEGMVPAQAGELLLQGCGLCGGVWMDDTSSRRLVAEPSEEAARLASLAAQNAKRPVTVDETLSCPVCDKVMGHHDFPNAKLRLDVCAGHGTWFDRGELPVLVALVSEQHRKRDELERAIAGATVGQEFHRLEGLYASSKYFRTRRGHYRTR